MKISSKILVLLLCAALLVGTFSACGSSAATTTTAAAATEAAVTTAANREGEVNQDAYQAEQDTSSTRTLTFGIQEYGIGVDPAQEVNTAWNCSRYGIGECLFRFDNSMNVVNYLCDSYEVNEEHTEWKLHIREGIKFSDGCDLTAQKVADSFARLFADGANGSAKPKTYLSPDSVITADNSTGVVTIVTPSAVVDLTKNLCYPVMIILDTEHTTDYVAAPIGTGPYKAESFTEHVGMTVLRNDLYWNGEVPYEKIELIYMGDASAKAYALQSGQIDLAENITNIDSLNKLRNDPNFTVTIAPGVRTGLAHMNVAEGKLLSNETLRHAVLKALDDDTMCSVTVGGLYTSGYSVLPSNLDYGYDQLVDPDSYNVEEAISMLDAAGIVDTNGDGIRELNGEEVILHYVTYPNRCLDSFAEAIQLQLAEIGIGVDLEVADSTRQWDSYATGDFDLNGSNWTTVGTGDPTQYLTAWYSKGSEDYCGYQNDEFDTLFDELLQTFDNARRQEIIQRLQQILLDDGVVVVHGYYNSSMISNNSAIGGAAINTADYYWVTTGIYPAA